MGSGVLWDKGKASHCNDAERRREMRGQKLDGVAALILVRALTEASRNALAPETESKQSGAALRNAGFLELRG
jgi:hypothetical protein